MSEEILQRLTLEAKQRGRLTAQIDKDARYVVGISPLHRKSLVDCQEMKGEDGSTLIWEVRNNSGDTVFVDLIKKTQD